MREIGRARESLCETARELLGVKNEPWKSESGGGGAAPPRRCSFSFLVVGHTWLIFHLHPWWLTNPGGILLNMLRLALCHPSPLALTMSFDDEMRCDDELMGRVDVSMMR